MNNVVLFPTEITGLPVVVPIVMLSSPLAGFVWERFVLVLIGIALLCFVTIGLVTFKKAPSRLVDNFALLSMMVEEGCNKTTRVVLVNPTSATSPPKLPLFLLSVFGKTGLALFVVEFASWTGVVLPGAGVGLFSFCFGSSVFPSMVVKS